MGFTGAHMLHTIDVFILALYLLFHGCALLKYTCKQKIYIVNRIVSEEIYTTGKNITLPAAVTALTNITSAYENTINATKEQKWQVY